MVPDRLRLDPRGRGPRGNRRGTARRREGSRVDGADRETAGCLVAAYGALGFLARLIDIAVAVVAVIIAVGVLLVVLEANPANDIVDLLSTTPRRGSPARSTTSSRSTTPSSRSRSTGASRCSSTC